MCQGHEVCLLLVHSRQQLRSRTGKYGRKIKTRGREERVRTKDMKKTITPKREIKTRWESSSSEI